uniref:Uncharacterized protein n=1 Tax=Avena sativa TaxID=4498 RepID=A0ACD5UHJ4_AVESA
MSANVVINKSPSVAVRPPEPAAPETGCDIDLSPYDKMFVGAAPATVFLVFEHPIHEPAETVRRGLSRALVHYYPIAGRLDADEAVIRCTGDGVAFVAARADCAMNDVKDFSDPSLQEELAIFYPAASYSQSQSRPLALVQVTVFNCGGFVVAVTWDHAVCDGVGLAQFLQAVGELARGLPAPSVVPVRTSDALTLPSPPPFSTDFMQFMASSLEPCPMALLDITIPSSLISRIKHDYSLKTRGKPCSAFDAVAAVLWRCRTRAVMSHLEDLTVLAFTENARGYAGARAGYYGNCVTAQPVTATSGAVASSGVLELVQMIRRGKERVPDRSDMDRLRTRKLAGYNLLGMTSWRGLGLEVPDFGGGRPARVMGYWRDRRTSLPVCAACLPCKDDYNVVSMCVREDHANAFRHELAMMQHNPLSSSSKL